MAMDFVLTNGDPPTFESGTPVPARGSYWILHDRHRAPHVCRISQKKFPKCRHCGQAVRFRPMLFEPTSGVKELRHDPDFVPHGPSRYKKRIRQKATDRKLSVAGEEHASQGMRLEKPPNE